MTEKDKQKKTNPLIKLLNFEVGKPTLSTYAKPDEKTEISLPPLEVGKPKLSTHPKLDEKTKMED